MRLPGRSATRFLSKDRPPRGANAPTSGWPTNSAKPGRKSAGSNGKKQQRRSSAASIFGMRPFFQAQTWGQTTCTVRMPFAFA